MLTLLTALGISFDSTGVMAASGPTSAEDVPGDPNLPTGADELQALIDAGEGDFKYSVEDFFRNPEKSSFQISPEGDFISYMAPYQNRLNLFIQKIGEKEAKQITFLTDRSIGGYLWGNNDRLLYIKDDGGDENFKLFAVDRDGENSLDLTPFDKIRIDLIDDLEDNKDEIIIGMNKENPMLFEPYRLNINTGEYVKLADNKDPLNPIAGWMTDHQGRLRLATQMSDGTNSRLLYRATEEDEFQMVLETDFREGLEPQFFDFENESVIWATSNLGRDKQAVVKFDLSTGKEIEVVYEHPQVDVGGVSYSRKRKVPLRISYTTDKRAYHILDNEFKGHYEFLTGQLPDYEVVITSMNDDEDKWLIRTFSDRSLGAYYMYDTKTKDLTHMVDVSPWIEENDMAEMKPVKYTARDGMTIHGYLTLPKDVEAKDLPVIVNPHGGPWVRDNWGWDPTVQFLASRGYAVLQMNYRGSTGYGRAFWESSFKKWGQEMQNDVSDGVKWLISEGIADPEKVGIFGGSYGGYATLAGLAYSPDLYACGVDFVGVSNLFSFLETIPPYWKPYLEMMYEMVGHPEEDKEMLTAYSPALNAEKITAPLFVAQGANDPRVNIDESDQIVKAIRAKGVEVPYMVKYDEGHGYHNEENRIEFYKAMAGFLAKHLK